MSEERINVKRFKDYIANLSEAPPLFTPEEVARMKDLSEKIRTAIAKREVPYALLYQLADPKTPTYSKCLTDYAMMTWSFLPQKNPDSVITVHLSKTRSGSTGSINLSFDPEFKLIPDDLNTKDT